MARTVIDLDEATVAEVMEIFGTTVKAQAVRAALEDVVKRRRRQVGIDMLKSGELLIEDQKAGTETDTA
ncbi:Arc/MetJ family transcription regulator [Catenulispora sp. GAS73]|uniref:type II toxin-antitoxin system VapB family antitoxin n=1 Tax=Catenulispora sp. GAS73 TaxID=3156269 RepID=UPI0035184411